MVGGEQQDPGHEYEGGEQGQGTPPVVWYCRRNDNQDDQGDDQERDVPDGCPGSDPGPGPVGALQVTGEGGVGDEEVVLDRSQDLLLAGGETA